MTEAEKRMWYLLRRRNLGKNFRRQAPIGPFVVDFACLSARLIIELDGGQHAAQSDEDEKRTAWLVAQGYHVLRFWNNDVLGNTQAVLEAVVEALEDRVRSWRLPSP
jgi:very-short-patch-repair endonuclease